MFETIYDFLVYIFHVFCLHTREYLRIFTILETFDAGYSMKVSVIIICFDQSICFHAKNFCDQNRDFEWVHLQIL